MARARCRAPEDCVQEAFIRLAAQDPTPDDPLAWLARVVRNQAISQARQATRREQRERVVAAQSPGWFEAPLQSSDLQPRHVQQALAQLPSEEREILVAHVWGGLSIRQIATAFELSRSTVHRRYTSAIEQLRNELEVMNDSSKES